MGYSINNVLGGGATGATACTSIGYCGSVSITMPTKQMPKPYISTGAGIGGGYSISTDVMFRVTGGK